MKAALDDAWRNLYEMVGHADHIGRVIVPLAELAPFDEKHQGLTTWLQKGMEHNIELNIRRTEASLFDIERKMIRGNSLPIVSFIADHTYTQSSDGLMGYGADEKEYRYGVMANMPLFRSGETIILSDQAQGKVLAAKKRIAMQLKQFERELRSAYAAMKTACGTILAYQDAITAGKRALEGKKIGYQEGVSTSLDVLNTQRDYFRELREYYKTRYRFIMSVLNVKKLAGVLSEKDLVWINGQLGA